MTVELVTTSANENFIANLQDAFKRADGSNKFRTEDLPLFFDKTHAKLFNIVVDKKIVGGVVVILNAETNRNKLSLLFVNADSRNQGIGYATWLAIEKLFPATKIWEVSTSWQDKRNLHFYLNKCGFHAVKIYNPRQSIQNTDDEIYLALEKIMG